MKKLSKFNEAFSEPLPLSDGSYALSAELYPHDTDAAAEFERHFEEPVTWQDVRLDAARFGFSELGH
jgi:hypothetical protein